MKKILILTFLSIFLVSCGTSDEENNQENNTNNQNQETQTWNTQSWETQTWTNDEESTKEDELGVEDIYEITEEESGTWEVEEEETGTWEEDITEEEILEDIDALINEIINTTENEWNTK